MFGSCWILYCFCIRQNMLPVLLWGCWFNALICDVFSYAWIFNIILKTKILAKVQVYFAACIFIYTWVFSRMCYLMSLNKYLFGILSVIHIIGYLWTGFILWGSLKKGENKKSGWGHIVYRETSKNPDQDSTVVSKLVFLPAYEVITVTSSARIFHKHIKLRKNTWNTRFKF